MYLMTPLESRKAKRSEYPIPSVLHLHREIGNAKVFTLADIKSNFWHVPLDEESSLLTTFNTPIGRMKWNRMPFGISVAPEEFQRRIDENLEGLEGVKVTANDILVWVMETPLKRRQPTTATTAGFARKMPTEEHQTEMESWM